MPQELRRRLNAVRSRRITRLSLPGPRSPPSGWSWA